MFIILTHCPHFCVYKSILTSVGLYIDGVEAEELDSNTTYILDTEQSTCTYKDGTEIPDLSISYDSETGGLSISPYTTKGTKCTLYFNEQVLVRDTLLANYPTQLTRTFPISNSTKVTNTTTGTIYYEDTSKGRTYYFAGNPTDNWVQFGGFYWRIIRINEDGTVRMIYQGTETNVTGEDTQIQTSTFNSNWNNNMYVGYMYDNNQVHGLMNDSTIKKVLDRWYQNNLVDVADEIDGNAGFCGDRTPYSGTGLGITVTNYAAFGRFSSSSNVNPTFECTDKRDLYTTSGSEDGNGALTYPIGLITIDEVVYAGGARGTSNSNLSYYLYTGEQYLTMTPYVYNGSTTDIFMVTLNGSFLNTNTLSSWGVRPVINLKADVQITGGSGTSSNPYVIS